MKPWLLAGLLLALMVHAQSAPVTTLLTAPSLSLLGQDALGLYVSTIHGQRIGLVRVAKLGGEVRAISPQVRMGDQDFSTLWLLGSVYAFGKSVYYADGGSRVYKLPQAGGAKPAVVFELPAQAREPLQITGLVSDGVDLYVFGGSYEQARQCQAGADNVLWRVPVLGGGKPTQLAQGLACPAETTMHHFSAAVDDTNVYFLQFDPKNLTSSALWRVPKRGGALTRVLEGTAQQIALDTGFVYALARDGDGANLTRTPKAGSATQVLARLERPAFAGGTGGIAVVDSVAEPKLPTLRILRDGRLQLVTAPWTTPMVSNVFVDAGFIYWVERVPGKAGMSLKRRPL